MVGNALLIVSSSSRPILPFRDVLRSTVAALQNSIASSLQLAAVVNSVMASQGAGLPAGQGAGLSLAAASAGEEGEIPVELPEAVSLSAL